VLGPAKNTRFAYIGEVQEGEVLQLQDQVSSNGHVDERQRRQKRVLRHDCRDVLHSHTHEVKTRRNVEALARKTAVQH
jgi:hypothetical protein